MPPKKTSAPSKKVEEKKKDKIIEDKTFGLKNKKGAKTQKYVEQVSKQVKTGGSGKTAKELLKQEEEKAKKKEAALKAKDELNVLFKPVQSVGKGVDPKSVVCLFFKQGQCTKGDKCKFSHDLAVARKTEKRNIFSDAREGEDGEKGENMDDWDEAKLNEVVNKKHGEKNGLLPASSIVCKFFVEAVELGKYGWFWDCPNGNEKCQYRHALPPGYILKKDKKKMEDQKETISLEELVDKERGALVGRDLNKITLESFLKWKKRKIEEKKAKAKDEAKKRKQEMDSGNLSKLTGRDLFNFRPELMLGDDAEADDMTYEREESDDEGGDDDDAAAAEGKENGVAAKKTTVKNIDLDEFTFDMDGVDASEVPTATAVAADPSAEESASASASAAADGAAAAAAIDPSPHFASKASSGEPEELGAIGGAIGGADPDPTPPDGIDAAAAAAVAAAADVDIDEALFDPDDLDDLDDELETLDIDS